MPAPDVRVRLSAEGVQEVVAALRKIQTASKETAHAAETSFEALKRSIDSAKQAAERFGLLWLIEKVTELSARITEFGAGAIEAAAQQKDLAETVGTTVSHMTALSTVAAISKTRLEVVTGAAGKLADKIDDLRAGVPEAVAQFKRFGLSVKDFPTNDTAVNLQTVGAALAHFKSDGEKAAGVADLLGEKLGRKAIPFLQKLIDLKGLAGALSIAQKSGFSVDDLTAAQLEEMQKRFQLLRLYGQGAVLEIMKGFGPSLLQVLDEATKHTDGSRSAFEQFGEIAGTVLRVMRALVTVGLVPVAEAMIAITESVKTSRQALLLLSEGASVSDVGRFIEVRNRLMQSKLDKVLNDANRAVVDIFRKPELGASGESNLLSSGGRRPSDDDKLRQARLAAARGEYAAELELLREHNRALEAQDQQAYDAGLLSLQQYFRNRNERMNAEFAAEFADLRRQQGEAGTERDPAARADKLATVEARRQALLEKYQAEQLQWGDDYKQKYLGIEKEIQAAEAETAATRGDRLTAELQKIDAEEKRLAANLVRIRGKSPAAAAAEAAATADVQRANARFEDLLATANRQLAAFESARQRVTLAITHGQLTEAEGARQLAELDRRRLPTLEQISAQLRDGAQSLGPDQQQKVEEFDLKVQGLRQTVQGLAADFRGSLRDSLSAFLGGGINGFNSLADAARGFGLALAQSLQQKAGDRAATGITNFLGDLLGFAEGGYVSGPGGPTADAIPAMLSAGEYVLPSRVVARPGVLAGLEALRTMPWVPDVDALFAPRRYASGGLVQPAARSTGAGGLNGRISVELSDDLIGRVLEHPKFSGQVLKVVGKNPRAVRGLLGN